MDNELKNWSAYEKLMIEKCKAHRIPFKMLFELTPLCNFNCNMCYVHLTQDQMKKAGKMLSAEQWIELGKQAKKAGSVYLELTGGEIFTRPDFREIYEALYAMGFLVVLRTNGYLVTDAVLDWLKDRKPYLLMITLYGASDDTYKKVCGIPDGFTTVSRNIERLQNIGINVQATMTLTADNEQDREQINQWGDKHGIKVPAYGGLIQPNKNTSRGDIGKKRIQSESYDDVRIDCPVTDFITPKAGYSRIDAFSMCKHYGARLCVSWDGRLMVCNTLTSIYEDPFEDSLTEAAKRLYTRTDQIKRPPECAECDYFYTCESCPSSLYRETGYYDRVSEYICKKAERRCKMIYLDYKKKSTDNMNS